ncbi:hypothetical protein H1W37_19565 [Stappia taiwanensis]|uniref:Uncharacterized protein n=1 Tax=Stappia taiwanensis TaxID=992267 RepID=A0A838XTU5_9HYPH|nr:hypothetical protein [Stappia taiwanensis]MBA4613862.1 hypothetical protein [Stappia taiwanensis]GGF07436.1 hypothetical protein GCM10007285_39190 [Stappia taiwanensis]
MQAQFSGTPLIAETVAKMLLEIDAVQYRVDHPFTLNCGLTEPVAWPANHGGISRLPQ